MANAEKLLKLVEVVRAAHERGEWDMNFWAIKNTCGTSMCNAGYTCVMEGYKLQFESYTPSTGTLISGESIPDKAAEILDLTFGQQYQLFLQIPTMILKSLC